jgi:hypothetical protein
MYEARAASPAPLWTFGVVGSNATANVQHTQVLKSACAHGLLIREQPTAEDQFDLSVHIF